MSKQPESYEWIEAIRAAMSALDSLEMPEEHRKTIFRCLTAEFLEAVKRRDFIEEHLRDGKKWTPEDDQQLREALKGRVATTWAEERMNVQHASLVLRRSEDRIKKKAIELGLEKAVDYYHHTARP